MPGPERGRRQVRPGEAPCAYSRPGYGERPWEKWGCNLDEARSSPCQASQPSRLGPRALLESEGLPIPERRAQRINQRQRKQHGDVMKMCIELITDNNAFPSNRGL